MDNLGSFGAPAGGISPELQEAIQRRAGGNPSGPMGQTTQSAPTFDPTVQQPQVNPASVPSMVSASPPSPQGAGIGTPEAELIIKALDSRLKALSKMQGA